MDIYGICEPNAKLVAASPITGNCVYQTSGNRLVMLVRLSYELSLREGDAEIGRIVPGSDHSGSIWAGEECLGEYEYDRHVGSGYSVLPYESGRKKPEEEEEIHPLDYLLRFI